MRHVRGLWPSCISRVVVDMYSRIGALKSWCFNSAFAEDLTLLGLAWGWMLGRLPSCSLRNSAMGKSESYPGCVEGRWAIIRCMCLHRQPVPQGAGRRRLPVSLLQPRVAWARPSPRPMQTGEGRGTLQEADRQSKAAAGRKLSGKTSWKR